MLINIVLNLRDIFLIIKEMEFLIEHVNAVPLKEGFEQTEPVFVFPTLTIDEVWAQFFSSPDSAYSLEHAWVDLGQRIKSHTEWTDSDGTYDG